MKTKWQAAENRRVEAMGGGEKDGRLQRAASRALGCKAPSHGICAHTE